MYKWKLIGPWAYIVTIPHFLQKKRTNYVLKHSLYHSDLEWLSYKCKRAEFIGSKQANWQTTLNFISADEDNCEPMVMLSQALSLSDIQ